MKKVSFILISALLLFTSCSKVKEALGFNKEVNEQLSEASEDKTEKNNDKAEQELMKVSFCSVDSMVQLNAEIPYFEDSRLNDSILAYMDRNFKGYRDLYKQYNDADKAFKKSGEKHWNKLKEEIEELRNEWDEGDEIPDYVFQWEYTDEIIVEDINDNYVTFVNSGYEYQGGAHGSSWLNGTTLDRETGSVVTEKILKNTSSQAFQNLIKEKLAEYFENDDLESILFSNPNEQEIPVGNIRLYRGTIIIQYQQYELAPYAYGLPVVTFTFEEIKPFLTAEGLRLTGMK